MVILLQMYESEKPEIKFNNLVSFSSHLYLHHFAKVIVSREMTNN